jgi:hypothetical protein
VSTEEAMEFARERGFAFMETSAKDATGVNEAFLQVVTGKSSVIWLGLTLICFLLLHPFTVLEMYEKRSVLLSIGDRQGVPIGQPLHRRNGAEVEEEGGCC